MRSALRRGAALGASIVAVAGAPAAHGQTAASSEIAGGRGFSVTPSLSVTETLTDNSRLSTTDRQSDLVTQVTPTIRINSTSGRVRGFLDYSLTGLLYARNTFGNDLQNALNAAVNVEAVENWAFLDAYANISQQSTSAYGTRSTDSTLINANRTEVRTLTLSPYLKGRLGDTADYEARVTQNWTRNSTAETADNSSTLASVRIGSDTSRMLNWSADASHQAYDYSAGRSTVDDRVRGLLYMTVDPQLRFTLIVGREETDIASVDRSGRNTPGIGIDWTPSETTRLSAQAERRFFGNSHSLTFEHRTPRTVWSYSDIQDISTGFDQPTPGSVGTAYDLFFAQFASQQPDPVLRAGLVNAFLQANGISPSAQAFIGSLASAVTRQRRQQLSFALLGIRDTVTFGASQTQGLRVDGGTTVADDFANGNQVRSRGVSVGIAHRLTPSAALNMFAAIDRTSGTVAAPTTTLRSIGLYLTGAINSRSTYSLGAHHSQFSSPTNPYQESGLTAVLGMRF